MSIRDAALATQIQHALKQDPRVHEKISVGSSRGIVVLAGNASSRRGMLVAIQIAASFPECRAVINRQRL